MQLSSMWLTETTPLSAILEFEEVDARPCPDVDLR